MLDLRIKRRDYLSGYYYFGICLIFVIGGLVNFLGVGWLTPLLEPFFVVLAVLSFFKARIDRYKIILAALILLYVLYGFVFSVLIRQVNFLDFFQAYKCFWYLLLLVPISGVRLVSGEDLLKLNKLLISWFLLVYAIKRFVLGLDRPIVLTENNFELLLVCLVFYAASLQRDKIAPLEMAALGIVIFISGSRSAALCFAVILFFLLMRNGVRRKDILPIFGLFVAVLMGGLLFKLRAKVGAGVEDIDRVRFFYIFLEAIKNWNVVDYLFGEPRITALPQWACNQLSAYDELFSYKGDGSCYSVILHSFDMRVLYDHGIAGALFIIISLFKLMGRIPVKARFCVLSVLVANGLSVSAINNVYFALGLALLCSVRTNLVGGRRTIIN